MPPMPRWPLLAGLLLWLLPGCDGAPFQPAGSCTLKGGGAVFLEDGRDCSCLARQAEEAQRALEGLMPGALAAQLVATQRTWLHASDAPLDEGAHPWARYLEGQGAAGDIESERFNRSLVHELLHAYEIKVEGMPAAQSSRHSGWDEKGYTHVADAFWWRASPGAAFSCY